MKSCVERARELVEELNKLSKGEYEAFIEEVKRDGVIIRILASGCSECGLDLTQFLVLKIAGRLKLKIEISGASSYEPYTHNIKVLCSIQSES